MEKACKRAIGDHLVKIQLLFYRGYMWVQNLVIAPMLFTLRESWRNPDPALSGVRSRRLRLHPRRLGSEALQLSLN
jgi:hypothetical protein